MMNRVAMNAMVLAAVFCSFPAVASAGIYVNSSANQNNAGMQRRLDELNQRTNEKKAVAKMKKQQAKIAAQHQLKQDADKIIANPKQPLVPAVQKVLDDETNRSQIPQLIPL